MLGATLASIGARAHPLTEPGAFPVSPATVAAIATLAVLVVAAVGAPSRRPPRPAPAAGRRFGSLTAAHVAGRAAAVAGLGLAVAAGRLGSPSELDNLAPAAVVGVAWPALILCTAVLGHVWAYVDPFDGLARPLDRLTGGPAGGTRSVAARDEANVAWAVPAALAWTYYLSVYPDTLAPAAVGAAVAVYTVVMAAGCLAVGRAAWLGRAEVFGLFFEWLARLRRGEVVAWIPPRNADVVLGILAGGVWFGEVRRSELWGELNVSPSAWLWAGGGWALACVAGAAVVRVAARRDDAAVVGAVPVVAGIAVAAAIARNRLFVSIQLLPELMTDPFGRGWNPLGLEPATPALVDTRALAAIQVAVLVIGAAVGARLARRRSAHGGWLAVGAVCILLVAAVLIVTASTT